MEEVVFNPGHRRAFTNKQIVELVQEKLTPKEITEALEAIDAQ
jgi:hypothetical protein